jgi:hypothetical protein
MAFVYPCFLWAGGNAKRDHGKEFRLRSAVPCSHAHKATAKTTHALEWVAFGRIPKFERGRL